MTLDLCTGPQSGMQIVCVEMHDSGKWGAFGFVREHSHKLVPL